MNNVLDATAAEDQKTTLLMPTNCLRLMECLYIILEAGCNIKRLTTSSGINERGAQIVLVFGFNKNTWTIKSAAACATDVVNAIYDCLETLNIISKMKWTRHKINFLCHSDGIIKNNNKNIEIMQCVMNAMNCGWRVRKSSIRSEYTFNKRHKMKYKYLSGNFLPRFLDNMNNNTRERETQQREVFE